jgi:formylglycine-generating enzyme required for sulfatase activity
MVAIAGGTFRMGGGEDNTERPAHAVVVAPFLIGRYPVTLREWKECVAAQSCASQAGGSGDDDGPATNLSWDDARQYVTWLAQRTGKPYRLPTEAEWEYAARGGTETKYWWGNAVAFGVADCRGCGEPYDARKPLKVGSRAPNPFGLYDMGGGVAQWVEDCWHRDYHGAPATSVAWTSSLCREHVLRGGSWKSDPSYLRTTSREYYDSGVRYPTHGLRVARSP